MGLLWSFWPWQSHRWTGRGASPQCNRHLHQRVAEHWSPGQTLVGCGTRVLVVWWFKAITVMHVVIRSLNSLSGYELNLFKQAEQNWGVANPENNSKGKTGAGNCMQVEQSFRYFPNRWSRSHLLPSLQPPRSQTFVLSQASGLLIISREIAGENQPGGASLCISPL